MVATVDRRSEADKLSHRLNNQLTVILGRAQCALGSPCDDRMHGDLVVIAEGSTGHGALA